MKKTSAALLAIIISCTVFSGCSITDAQDKELPFMVYSFSAENDFLSISNGVLVLDSEKETLYGGNLELKGNELSEIKSYSTDYFILSDNEKNTLMSNSVTDETGGTIDISNNLGTISGDIIKDTDIEHITNGLYFELNMTDSENDTNTYQLKMNVTDITK